MSTDYFQSHTIPFILSWFFTIPTIIGLIVYANVQVAKNQHWFAGLLLIWIYLCMIVLSPFRYMFLQLIMAGAYPWSCATRYILALSILYVLHVLLLTQMAILSILRQLVNIFVKNVWITGSCNRKLLT